MSITFIERGKMLLLIVSGERQSVINPLQILKSSNYQKYFIAQKLHTLPRKFGERYKSKSNSGFDLCTLQVWKKQWIPKYLEKKFRILPENFEKRDREEKNKNKSKSNEQSMNCFCAHYKFDGKQGYFHAVYVFDSFIWFFSLYFYLHLLYYKKILHHLLFKKIASNLPTL